MAESTSVMNRNIGLKLLLLPQNQTICQVPTPGLSWFCANLGAIRAIWHFDEPPIRLRCATFAEERRKMQKHVKRKIVPKNKLFPRAFSCAVCRFLKDIPGTPSEHRLKVAKSVHGVEQKVSESFFLKSLSASVPYLFS